MADINSIEDFIKGKIKDKHPLGKVIIIDLIGEGSLRLDASVSPVTVERDSENKKADLTMALTADHFDAMMNNQVQFQSLMMTGRAKLKGNPMIAMFMRMLLF
jgi:putative sterol carrier protein